jgi:exosortase A-associated hydrolase 1
MTANVLREHPGHHEEALAFACQGEQLVGVVSLPAAPASSAPGDLALLVVVGGPQVRAGSHRQFTQLCRAAAAAGVPAMRFDVRGMGDSTGPLHTFEHIGDDISAALDALQARLPDVKRVVLWGLCDGASAALMHVHNHRDARVAGLVLLNPWVRSAQTLARAHVKHYYWNRLRQGEFWRKLLGGGVALRALRDLAGNLRAAGGTAAPAAAGTATALPFQERMLRGAEAFDGPVLWVLSGQDYTAKEFVELAAQSPRWQGALARPQGRRLDMAEADHTFSTRADEAALAEATVAWLRALGGPAA